MIVTGVLVVTVAVVAVNVALAAPAAIVTLAGTVAAAVLPLDRATTAPPVGAPLDSVTVPVDAFPPTTLVGFTVTAESVAAAGAVCGVKRRVAENGPATPDALRARTRHHTRWPPASPLSVTCDVVTVGLATKGAEIDDELSTCTS